MIKKANTLSEMVAKLKCGSYIRGAKDDAVCNSAFACVKKDKKDQRHRSIDQHIFVIFGKRTLYPGRDL